PRCQAPNNTALLPDLRARPDTRCRNRVVEIKLVIDSAGRVTCERPGVVFLARMQQQCHQPGPPGLMRSTHASPAIAMKIFVKQYMIAEFRVVSSDCVIAKHRAPVPRIAQEDAACAAAQLLGNFAQTQQPARAGRALHSEVVAIIAMELV